MDDAVFQRLVTAAQNVRRLSYSPISNFKVGAAITTARGALYAGTNVEEAALNHSIHAEQGAIAQMVATEGRVKITGLVVVGGREDDQLICAPCGHCRQLLLEFADDDLPIWACGPAGDVRMKTTLGALMPQAFRLGNFLSQ